MLLVLQKLEQLLFNLKSGLLELQLALRIKI